jgi:hypothetical protein
METKHSPGPWKLGLSKNDNEPIMLAIFPQSAKEGERSKIICLISEAEKIHDYDILNAKLIASAPELLESLIKILDNFKSCIEGGNGQLETDAEDIAKAEAVIKKATV